ncbi:sigma factor-like helix-turn-helix DNA-binding protein [Oribacterium sp. P6A1]|uniref:sigma factor-like helix-turn-helix DNA-binding protein n=1 Tax=Oribacterium sp. P6A1 TaxID=1410612 RepID=UPI00056CFC36|nr:sigma factor-like helix-turn-helix DNA-binding protein [Oribacterium sp. P6A1]
MDDFVVRGNLYELYGGLLNENQRKVYEYHVVDDMSFTEIGEEMGTSRQAAQELFRRADKKLKDTEDTLGLQSKLINIRERAVKILEHTKDNVIQKLAGEIIDGV